MNHCKWTQNDKNRPTWFERTVIVNHVIIVWWPPLIRLEWCLSGFMNRIDFFFTHGWSSGFHGPNYFAAASRPVLKINPLVVSKQYRFLRPPPPLPPPPSDWMGDTAIRILITDNARRITGTPLCSLWQVVQDKVGYPLNFDPELPAPVGGTLGHTPWEDSTSQ